MNVAIGVVDMQDYFLRNIDGNVRKKMIDGQKALLHYAVNSGMRIFLIEFEASSRKYNYGRTTACLENIWKKQFINLRHKVQKNFNDGFKRTEFDEMLQRFGVDYLGLVGINASACFFETARSAIERGYFVGTSLDLIANGFETGSPPDYLDERTTKGRFFKNHLDISQDYLQFITHLCCMKNGDSLTGLVESEERGIIG